MIETDTAGTALQTLTFRSRIDPLLVAITFGPVVVVLGMLVRQGVQRGAMALGGLSILALSLGLLAWIFLDTGYRITGEALLVRSGPLRMTVPLPDLRTARRTRSILSAPALSLRRLELTYGSGKVVVISPLDETGFLTALKARAPQLELKPG